MGVLGLIIRVNNDIKNRVVLGLSVLVKNLCWNVLYIDFGLVWVRGCCLLLFGLVLCKVCMFK